MSRQVNYNIMRSSSIAEILNAALTLDHPRGGSVQIPVRVQGATLPCQAVLISHYLKKIPSPVLVVCPNEDLAETLTSDVECISACIEGCSITSSCIPTWEHSPYSPVAPSLKVRLRRISQLSLLAHGDIPRLMATTIPALCQATLPREFLIKNSLCLKTEDSVESRERLVARLIEMGYLRVDPVEDPGTFAIRGDIIDIFLPSRKNPVRIELFGDLIEKIREFDPHSQRTTSKSLISNLVISPAREVLICPTSIPMARERIKAFADNQEISRAIRDPLLGSISNGNYPEYSDTWAPFVYPEPATLFQYLPDTTTIIWIDEPRCLQGWEEFQAEQVQLSQDRATSSRIIPAVETLFKWTPNFEKQLKEKTSIFFDQLDLSVTPSSGLFSKHRVAVQGNTDLVRGTRHSLEDFEFQLRLWSQQRFQVVIFASTQSQLERIQYLLNVRGLVCQLNIIPQAGTITLHNGALSEGLKWPTEGFIFITDREMLGSPSTHPKRGHVSSSTAKTWSGLQALTDLAVGDAVVHVDHGIGKYQGLVRLSLSGAPSDFLLMEYANRDRLYLPVYRMSLIQKYVGAGGEVALDRLGSQQFAKTKEKVREAVKKLAIDLVRIYAERKICPGIPLSPQDAFFREFEAKFLFDETPDQQKAIEEVLADLESGKVMDRLVCGDVGYGKTEVAMRAAFRSITDGKQVAVLVPTTILAFQHELSFKARMKDYPIIIESLSRFKSAKEQKAVLENIASGKIDLTVGTHRLLSRDVRFRDLGLIIVDEEHRFGVEHKERLKTLKVNTHVLTLTATPIPRTLHMALAGLRDISLMNTAPVDRLPIRTYVSNYDEALIQKVIDFELKRGGQVFFVHNRVQSIYATLRRLQELLPAVRFGVAHGQLPERELQETMVAFYEKRSDVLICTSIIESGLDIPFVNTVIIDRADTLGLAQLYQIRGRVGRGQNRAYAYLLIPPEGFITDEAKQRLEVIQRFVELGSGFSIASHDLEIRGGGDLLGPQQSGHIAAVGFDLYTELLEEAIREMKEGSSLSDSTLSVREPEIKAPFPAYLSEDYVPDIHQRLSLYRRFSGATQDSEVDRFEEELQDRFGSLPLEAQNLLWLIRVRLLLKQAGIEALTIGPEKISLVPGSQSRFDPRRVVALVSKHPDQWRILPDSKIVAQIATSSLRELFFTLEGHFKDLMMESIC